MSLISAAVGIVSPPAGLALKALGWLKGSLGYMAKHWQLTLAVAACLVAAWALHGKAGAIKRADREHAANAALIQASNTARAKAIAQKADLERKSKEQADAADKAYTASLADARSATDRYIASHRMRPANADSGGTIATASGDGAGVRDALPEAGILVAADDLQSCAAWQAYGVTVHDWAVTQFKP